MYKRQVINGKVFAVNDGDSLVLLVNDNKIKIRLNGIDKHDRIIGDLFLGNEYINLYMVLSGNAWHYARFNDDLSFKFAEERAKKRKLGLWQGVSPLPPWSYRRGVKKGILSYSLVLTYFVLN